jgi:hypothetical protein
MRHSLVMVENELALLTNNMSKQKPWDMRLHMTDVRVYMQNFRSVR